MLLKKQDFSSCNVYNLHSKEPYFNSTYVIGGCKLNLVSVQFIPFQMTSFLEKTIGVHGMFTSFGFICILFVVFTYKLVPETHGKSYRDSVLVKSLLEKETQSQRLPL